MSRVLDPILAQKRLELPELRQRRLPAPPSLRPLPQRRGPSEPLRLIAENKRRSPSAGDLSTELSVRERAAAYAEAGADMLSILCDSHFFGGAWEHLAEAREGCALPLLAKEFIIDEAQLDAAAAFGASAALLIVRCVPSDRDLERLLRAAEARNLVGLVEITTEPELERALAVGAHWIGVNARDLDTLAIDLDRAARVLAAIPPTCMAWHLSGIREPAQVRELLPTRADGALIGEALMRQNDPRALLASLVDAARHG